MFSWSKAGGYWPPLLVFALCLIPGRALAAGGGGVSSEELSLVVLLIAFVVLAYLLAHSVVKRIQERYLIVTGIEYLALGWVIGPNVEEIPSFDQENFTAVLPIIALAAGWFGLLRGTDAKFRDLLKAPPGTGKAAVIHHVLVGAAVGFSAYHLLAEGWVPGVETQSPAGHLAAAIASMMLGCCAAAHSAPIDLLQARYRIDGTLHDVLGHSSRLGDVLVIFAFGMMFCLFHPHEGGDALRLSPTEWCVVTMGCGLTLGALFVFFLGEGESENVRFLALVGIITFASGAAFFLQISPLLVNLILGFVLVNFAKAGESVRQTLNGTQKPMYLVLLIFAGAIWSPPPFVPFLFVFIGFVSLRVFSKVIASRLAGTLGGLRPDLFRGLLAHGEITIAMAISFKLVYPGELAEVTYSVIIASVIFHDLIAPRMLRALLVDSGEITREATQEETEEPTALENG